MLDKILNRIKEYLDIDDYEPIDFSNIDRNNPPIFGPEDIFEDLYDEEDGSDIVLIVLFLIIAVVAFVYASCTFIEIISTFTRFSL